MHTYTHVCICASSLDDSQDDVGGPDGGRVALPRGAKFQVPSGKRDVRPGLERQNTKE